MTRYGRWRALSAVAATLGLTAVAVLAVGPVLSAGPAASAARSPGDNIIEGDAGPPWAEDEPEPVVTVTITKEPEPVVTKTITKEPEPVVTKTITKEPEPEQRPTPTSQPLPRITEPAIELPPGGFPTTAITPTPSPTVEEGVSLAPATPQYPDPGEQPTTEQQQPTLEAETPYSVPIELRQAPPEYDQLSWSRKLAIPGIVLVLLMVLAVLILHGRLQRMAHAAAVRHAGPRSRPGGGTGLAEDYPMAGYPQVVFVPVQTFPGAPPAAPVDYGWGAGYPPAAWAPAGPASAQPVAEYWTEPAPPFPAAGSAGEATTPAEEVTRLIGRHRRPKPGRRRKNDP